MCQLELDLVKLDIEIVQKITIEIDWTLWCWLYLCLIKDSFGWTDFLVSYGWL